MKLENKTDFLQIRLTSVQKSQLKAAAARDNMSVSEWVLNKLLNRHDSHFQELIEQLARHSDTKFILAEMNDFLTALDSNTFRIAVEATHVSELPSWLANYVAAMVELAAHQKRVNPPTWCHAIPPLDTPYFGSDLKNIRLYLLTHSPPPFRRRNLFIDTSIGGRV